MLLAIDTSTGTSVALIDPDRGVLAETGTDDAMRHAEAIGSYIREVLDAVNISSSAVRSVAVGMGPGPYTGLRVGIAAARAFALGLGRAWIPVVSHDAIARQWYDDGGSGPLQVVTDARRREFAYSNYRSAGDDGVPQRLGDPALAPRDAVPAFDAHRVDAARVSAASIGLVAVAARRADRLPIAPNAPLYLRSPDVTPSPGKKVSQ